jgi:hypothetical protein
MRGAWWLRIVRRLCKPISRVQRRQSKQHKLGLRLELLEGRDVPSVAAPDYILFNHTGTASPFGTSGPTGYTPAQIEQAYGINQISFNGTAGTGAGTTIAIVDAYNDPNIKTDLHNFDQQFGLADPTFSVVNQNGGSTLPSSNKGWAGEISLDVEWAHAIAPGAKILLVESNSASFTDLLTAVSYAASQPGVVAVSMSWGGGEFSGEKSNDSSFLPTSANPGVVFVNSSGDSGAPASYPSTSPNVLSVGGTTLNLTGSNAYSSESAWTGSGGGISAYESQPSYQQGVVTQSTTKRTSPDVSYDANPNTGFPVYQTYGNSGGPWLQYGGTSDASPQWAALIAIADQGRNLAGEGALTNATLMPMLYKLPSADFHDVTSGSSTGSPSEKAGVGYDLATGLGTPVANLLVPALVGGTGNTNNVVTHFAVSISASVTAGSPFSVTVKAENASNAVVAGYTGTVTLTSSDGAAILPGSYTFKSGDAGSHTFTGVVLNSTGSQSVTATDGSGITGTTSANVSASSLSFSVSGIPTTAIAGQAYTVTVDALSSGSLLGSFNATVNLASSDHQATLPGSIKLVGGTATFSVTFGSVGSQSFSVSNPANGAMTGGVSVTVMPGAVASLAFQQQPANTTIGGTDTVTVQEFDAYHNLVTTDSNTQITLVLGSNPGYATLTGGGTVTVKNGVATFSGLSLDAAGSGYNLTASTVVNGNTITATSNNFNVSSTSSNVIEDFESGLGNYYYIGNNYPFAVTTTKAAHDGSYGMSDPGDGNWYFRMDSGAVVSPGDTLSVWVDLAGRANGRAYIGFGTSLYGTDSIVLAPNSNQFMIQNNNNFNYSSIAAATQRYSANSWYRVELDWSTSGAVTAKLYASDGSTLLNSITAANVSVTPGWFAFRSTGYDTYFDTVTDTPNVNNFAAHPASAQAAYLPASTGTSFFLSPAFTGFTTPTVGSGAFLTQQEFWYPGKQQSFEYITL